MASNDDETWNQFIRGDGSQGMGQGFTAAGGGTTGEPFSRKEKSIPRNELNALQYAQYSVGLITIMDSTQKIVTSTGTGFVVGDGHLMTACHVISEQIEDILHTITHIVLLSKDNDFQTWKTDFLGFEKMEPYAAVKGYYEKSKKNLEVLISSFKEYITGEDYLQLNQVLVRKWLYEVTVQFENKNGTKDEYTFSPNIPFLNENIDVAILKIQSYHGRKLPESLPLADSAIHPEKVNILGYIKKKIRIELAMDPQCEVYTKSSNLAKNVTEAINWWKEREQEIDNRSEVMYDKIDFEEEYKDCVIKDGEVLLNASPSFVHGTAGSPMIEFKEDGITKKLVVVGIYLRGYPMFYYKIKKAIENRNRLTGDCRHFNKLRELVRQNEEAQEIDKIIKMRYFIEAGTTMKNLADKLPVSGMRDMLFPNRRTKEEHLYHQSQVVWKWRQGSKHMDFSEEHNTAIEKAYQAKHKTSIVEINRTSYRINFKAMNMYKVNDDKVSFTVMRVDIPKPILGMPKKKVDQYLEAVSQGKMPTRNIRLMLVGHERVGKTSLCKNLLKDRDQGSNQDRTFKGDTDGTDGIDIYIYSYEINMKTKKRTKLEKPDHQIAVQKLGNLMNEHVKKKMDEVPEDEDDDVEECVDTTIPDHADSPSPAPVLTSDPERQLSSSFERKPISDDNITEVEIGHSEIITGDKQKQNFDVDDKEQEKLDRERTIPGNLLDDVKEAILASENAKPEDEMAYMSIWDFGGEDIFYDTHHIFLSTDAVYAVVFNIKECMEDEKYQERVRFWLRSIASIQGNEEVSTGKSQPPIIMVGTHLDQVPDRATGTFYNVCRMILQGNGMVPIRDQIKQYCPVENYNESPENEQKFEDLWEYIIEAASSQSQWEKDIPIKWFTLERELMKKKQDGIKVMTLNEVVDLDKKSESPIQNKEHIKLCLRYLHLTGVVLYFEDDLLEHFPKDEEVKLIIDPQWVVNAFRRVITDSKFTDNSKTAMSWQFMNHSKTLTRRVLKQFWNRPEDKQYKFLEHMEDLLKFMVKTGLLAQPVLQRKGEEVIKKDYYIVPSILDKPDYDWIDRHFQQKDLVSTHTLNITFEQMCIPFPVFHKLLAAFIVRFKFLDDDSTNLKKGFACFEVDSVWHLCIFCFNSTVKLTMSKYEQSPGLASIKAGIGKLVREFTVDTMKCILEAHGHYCKNISYQLSVCRYLKEGDQDVTVNVTDLQCLEEGTKIKRREEYFSRRDLKPWFCFPEEEGKAVAVPDFYPALNRTPTDAEFHRICKQIPITENMKSFFLELGLPDHVINIIEVDERDFVSRCYKAFQKWKQLFPTEATTRRIAEALKELNKDFSFLKSGIFNK